MDSIRKKRVNIDRHDSSRHQQEKGRKKGMQVCWLVHTIAASSPPLSATNHHDSNKNWSTAKGEGRKWGWGSSTAPIEMIIIIKHTLKKQASNQLFQAQGDLKKNDKMDPCLWKSLNKKSEFQQKKVRRRRVKEKSATRWTNGQEDTVFPPQMTQYYKHHTDKKGTVFQNKTEKETFWY